MEYRVPSPRSSAWLDIEAKRLLLLDDDKEVQVTDASRRFSLHIGALSPPIKDQLAEQGLTHPQVKHVQRDVDAINRLRVRQLLTDAEAHRACTRLMKKLSKELDVNG